MPSRKPKGSQEYTLPQFGEMFQSSFDLNQQDAFVTSLGVRYVHYKALPSPIGLKDRGDYRRSDALDTISSNGMIYVKAGCFTATTVDNSKHQKKTDGGIADESTSRLILPRFYDKNDEAAKGSRIYMAPGDRVYVEDKAADIKVSNYQKMEYSPNKDNEPMFPIKEVEFLMDSKGIEYREGTDFCITREGNIRWLQNGNNPGIDVDTGMGRVYSVRYLYEAFWYVVSIPKEVRITNITSGDTRSPERMAYHAVIQREYIYQNKNNGNNENVNQNNKLEPSGNRIIEEPEERIFPNKPVVRVDMRDIVEEDSD